MILNDFMVNFIYPSSLRITSRSTTSPWGIGPKMEGEVEDESGRRGILFRAKNPQYVLRTHVYKGEYLIEFANAIIYCGLSQMQS